MRLQKILIYKNDALPPVKRIIKLLSEVEVIGNDAPAKDCYLEIHELKEETVYIIISRYGAACLTTALVKIFTEFPIKDFPVGENVFEDFNAENGEPVNGESDYN
jgi:hypothetical protein